MTTDHDNSVKTLIIKTLSILTLTIVGPFASVGINYTQHQGHSEKWTPSIIIVSKIVDSQHYDNRQNNTQQ
jgi:hypothetical protein